MINLQNIVIDKVEFDIPFSNLHLNREEIISGMGYNKESPEHLFPIVDKLLDESINIIRPKGGFVIINPNIITISREKIFIGEFEINSNKIITAKLKKAESLALFVTSAGKELEEWINKLKVDDNLLEAFIVDTIGSEAAERSADYLESILNSSIKKFNWNMTNRYSPGYCEWNVSEQQKIFSLLPENFCNVKLTASSLMVPIKSISGIIGLGKNVKKDDYNCSFCEMQNCYRRKANE